MLRAGEKVVENSSSATHMKTSLPEEGTRPRRFLVPEHPVNPSTLSLPALLDHDSSTKHFVAWGSWSISKENANRAHAG